MASSAAPVDTTTLSQTLDDLSGSIPQIDVELLSRNIESITTTIAYIMANQMNNNHQAVHLNRIVTLFGIISLGTVAGSLFNSYMAMQQEAKINEITDRIGALEKTKQIKNKGE